jgi:serine/threonine protein kinase
VEHNLKSAEKQAFFVTLRRLAGFHGRLPDSMVITEKIEVEDMILASGGFADVRRGRYVGHLVAVKTLRVAEQDDFLKIRKVNINDIFLASWDAVSIILLQRFCKEVFLWNTLSHPNVLKLVGVQGDMERGQFITVSEWMAHGNIMEYIRNNHANRLELVRDFAFPTTSFIEMQQ